MPGGRGASSVDVWGKGILGRRNRFKALDFRNGLRVTRNNTAQGNRSGLNWVGFEARVGGSRAAWLGVLDLGRTLVLF